MVCLKGREEERRDRRVREWRVGKLNRRRGEKWPMSEQCTPPPPPPPTHARHTGDGGTESLVYAFTQAARQADRQAGRQVDRQTVMQLNSQTAK